MGSLGELKWDRKCDLCGGVLFSQEMLGVLGKGSCVGSDVGR